MLLSAASSAAAPPDRCTGRRSISSVQQLAFALHHWNDEPMRIGRVALTGVIVLVVACAPAPKSAASNQSTAGVLPSRAIELPSVTPPPGVTACVGQDLEPDAVLAGNVADDPQVWIQWQDKRVPVSWPPGYYAVFGPELTIFAPDGQLVARAGDDIVKDPQRWPGLLVCASTLSVDVFRTKDLVLPAAASNARP